MSQGPIVVVGGSVAGLAAALALAGSGRRVIVLEKDAAGETVYRIGGYPEWHEQPGSDIAAFRAGHITVTPLKVDMTDRRTMGRLTAWRLPVPPGRPARRR